MAFRTGARCEAQEAHKWDWRCDDRKGTTGITIPSSEYANDLEFEK
jgi:hypothetical protein